MNDPTGSNPYATPSAPIGVEAASLHTTYGGIGRLAYFGYTFLAAIVHQMVAVLLAVMFGGMAPGGGTAGVVFLLSSLLALFVYLGAILYIASQRLVNIGSSPWWCLGLIVPLLNIFVGVRCMVCPEGYDDHKTLDTPAKVMLGLAIACILLAVLSVIVTVVGVV